MVFPARALVFRLVFVLCAGLVLQSRTHAEDVKPAVPANLATVLKPFVESKTLAGAVVLVADQDKVLALESVGFADIAKDKPMQGDSVFWIASMSKPITAAALMILVDEGKVKLDDPVEKYLPEFKELRLKVEGDPNHPFKQPEHKVTVRHILSHTSGMPFSSPLEQPTLDSLPLRDAVRSYASTPLTFEPTTKYAYSNAGINTAGRIIEVVSGQPYEEFLQQRLLDPLQMTDTTFWPSEQQVTRLAKSYRPNAKKDSLEEFKISQLRYPLSDKTRGPMPAGGLFGTATDCAHFCQMLLAGGTYAGKRILSAEAVREMTKRQTGPDLKDSYGLGLSVGGDWYGHGGAHSTNMTVDTRRKLVYIYMVQHAGYGGTDGGKIQGAFTKAAQDLYAK